MKFGVHLPNCSEALVYPVGFAGHDSMVKIAQEAESLGYDSVWANDHMTTQKYVKELSDEPPNYYEPLVTHAVLAEATEKIKLGTSVVALPMRNPVILAKQVATLDVLSGGRLILGLGSGAYAEEFQALNPHLPTKARSKIMDESVAALNMLLTQRNASFEGEYVKFKDVEMYPKPLQKPLPTWICGNSINGIRRTAESGTGWSPATLLPEEVREGITKLASHSKTAGRENIKFEIAPQYLVSIGKTEEDAVRKYKDSLLYKHVQSLQTTTFKRQSVESSVQRNFIGTADQIIRKIEKLDDAGVSYLPDLVFPEPRMEDLLDGMRAFARHVMPSFS